MAKENGTPKDLFSRNLRTQGDLLPNVMYEHRISKRNGIPAKFIWKAVVAAVGEKISELWIKLKISIISVRCLKKQICQLHSRRRQPLQADARKRQTNAIKLKLLYRFGKLFVSQRI
jgi:hypothetical protein